MTLVVNLFMMIDESCPKPGHCEVRHTSTKCDYEESKRLWGAHQKTDRRQGNEPPKAILNPSCVVLPFLTFFIVYQVAAANPLKCVFTTWSYYSRVSIKAPDGINTIL